MTQASQLAVGLFIFLNVVAAVLAYPASFLADKVPKKDLLALGSVVFALACLASVFQTSNYAIWA